MTGARPGPDPVTEDSMRVSVRITGADRMATFKAMCALRGQRPHELAAQILAEAIEEGRHDHDTQALVTAVRAYRGGLVYGGPTSGAGCREMTRLLDRGDDT